MREVWRSIKALVKLRTAVWFWLAVLREFSLKLVQRDFSGSFRRKESVLQR